MRFWRGRSRGITLIEVLTGSALMGTLLVAVLVADARLKGQERSAVRRLEACRMADEILEGFFSSKDGVPADGSGEVAGREGWHWRTRRVESDCAVTLGGDVVALEIYGPGRAEMPPAVSVQVLVGGRKDEAPVGDDAH